jgi:hypothetical protein
VKQAKKDNENDFCRFFAGVAEKCRGELNVLEQERIWLHELLQGLDGLYLEKREPNASNTPERRKEAEIAREWQRMKLVEDISRLMRMLTEVLTQMAT